MDPISKKEMDDLQEAILKNEKLSASDFRRLYELAGVRFKEEFGSSGAHNPCSVETISKIVLKMAEEVNPCTLLNVGMGGYPFVDMELSRRGFSVTGLEYSASLAGIAHEVSANGGCSFPIILGDAQNLPFLAESFEACLCSETLEHLPDDRRALSEIHRVLKPDGCLILTVPNLWAFLGWQDRVGQFVKTRSWVATPSHVREYHFFSVMKLLKGFFEIKSWHAVPFTNASFSQMPYEKSLSFLSALPFLKWGSLSFAAVLKKI